MEKLKDFYKKNSRVLNALIFGIGGAALSKGLLMIFNIVVARMISKKDYGIYSLVYNTIQTFTIFAGAGIGATLTRYVALYRDKDKNMAGIIIKTLLLFNILVSIFISIIMFIFSSHISSLLSNDTDISIYLKMTSGTIFFTSFALILQSILQGFENYKKIALWQVLSNLLFFIIGYILCRYYHLYGTIIALLVLQIILSISFYALVMIKTRQNDIKLRYDVNNVVIEAIKKVAVPAFLSSVFVLPIMWIANFVFTKYNGYEEFAAFSVCLQWYTILNYLPQQLGQVKPIYTQLYDQGKIVEFKKILGKMMLIAIGFSVFCVLVLFGLSNFVLNMYGDAYLGYRMVFTLMLITSVFFAIQSQFGSVFFAIGKIWSSFALNLIWAIVFIIAFILFYKMGAIGYAYTYLISYSAYCLISLLYFRSVIKQRELIK